MNIYETLARGAAPNLPEQILQMSANIARMAASIDALNAALTAKTDVAPSGQRVAGSWYSLKTANPGNTFRTGVSVVGLILSADTAGLYHVNVGNDPTYLNVYLAANTPLHLVLDDEERIMLAPGVGIWLAADTGTPNISSMVCVVDREQPGRKAA